MINVGLINYTQFIAAAPGAAWSMPCGVSLSSLSALISLLLSVINNSPAVSINKAQDGNTGTLTGNEWIIRAWVLMLDA